jgi:membrane protein DedA with SNARE-associated domain
MLLASITSSITSVIGDWGLYAVLLLMLLGALVPAASEIVMLYGGALAGGAFASQHVTLLGFRIDDHLWAYGAIVLAGALGNIVGAAVGWGIGAYGGRTFLERHGRLLHVTPAKLARAERWFDRFGDAAVLLGWVTPLARSFVSYPAGIVRMPLPRFLSLTVAGALAWCLALAGAGWAVGSSWESVRHDLRFVEYAVIGLAVAVVAYLVLRAVRNHGAASAEPD